MLKIIIGLILVGHGVGHSMGLLRVLNVATVNPAWRGDSWVLTGVAGSSATSAIGAALWTVAILGFVALGGVVLGWLPVAWWMPVAVGASTASLAGLLLFPIAFPVFSSIGALAVNVAVLVAALWYHWVPGDLGA